MSLSFRGVTCRRLRSARINLTLDATSFSPKGRDCLDLRGLRAVKMLPVWWTGKKPCRSAVIGKGAVLKRVGVERAPQRADAEEDEDDRTGDASGRHVGSHHIPDRL